MAITTRRVLTLSERIGSAAEAVISARDMCADERGAIRDFEDDHGRFTREERAQVWSQAEAIWRQSQIEAGVTNPITPDERIRINAALEVKD